MPRIPDEEIERLKRETDLAALVSSRGVELARHGSKDLVGRCPFHADTDTPNFIVTPEKGLFHCMACGAAGNAIQFVQKFDGVSFRHAYELLAAGRPAFAAPPKEVARVNTVRRLDCPFDAETEDAAFMERVVAYYHDRLMKTPAALAYLEGRGLCHEEALKTFQIGFADRTLGLRIPEGNRKDGDALRARLTALGVWRESGHEHLTGCVVLPIRDEAGRVTEMYGRRITPRLRKGTPLHLYLPGPHAGVWNLAALSAPEIILCEAPLDALTFWVNGSEPYGRLRNVTFIYGTEGFTDELFDALRARHVQRVYLAYDADEAGNRAAARDAERLTAHGIECLRVRFPWGMDANEYAKKVQPAAKALQTVLDAAERLGGPSPTLYPSPAPPMADAVLPSCAVAPASSSLAAIAAPEEELQSNGTTELQPEKTGSQKTDEAAAKGNKAMPESDTSFSSMRSLTSMVNFSVSSASSVPPPPVLEGQGEYRVLRLGPREYRVGGLEKNNSLEVLKVALRLRHGETFHLDSFDLLQDGQRRRFIERAAEETTLEKDLIKRDLGKLLLALERAQEERLAQAVQPAGPKTPEMTAQEQADALALLKSPELIERITGAFPACGLAGEGQNSVAGVSGVHVAVAGQAPGDHHTEHERGGKVHAHGSGAIDVPGGRACEIQRHDRAEPLLPGRGESQAQDPGHRGRGRRGEGQLCLEAPAERRRTDHRQHRQGPAHGSDGNAGIPRRRGRS